jgi:hypothetical protein
MANKLSDNWKQAGDILVWTNLGGDTAVIYKYTCPVDSHKVVAPLRLGYAADTTTFNGALYNGVSGSFRCPVHDVPMPDGTSVSIT